MDLTDYHAKYFAYELTKRCASDSLEKLAGAVAGAQVDLKPHQVADGLLHPEHGWPASDQSGEYWTNGKKSRRLFPLKQPA